MMKLKKKLRQEIRENDDIFETSKKLKLGPGQYAEKYTLVKHKSPVTHFKPKVDGEPTVEEKQKCEHKMIRLFDGSASSIKNQSPQVALQPLEER
jgi:hypothetical protein